MLAWGNSQKRQKPRFIQITPNLHAPKNTRIVPPAPQNPVFPVVVDDTLSRPKPAPYTAPVPTKEHVHRQERIPCLTTDRLTVTGTLVSPELEDIKRRIEQLTVPGGGDSELLDRVKKLEAIVLSNKYLVDMSLGRK